MMKRKKITLLLLLIMIPLSVSAQKGGRLHTVSLFGFEPVSRYNNVVTGSGISLAQELYISTGRLLQIGGGFRYLFPRTSEDDEQLTWMPLYGAVKLFLPVESVPLYARGALGYSFLSGNSAAEQNKTDLKGGMYFNLGAGVDLPLHYTDSVRFSFVFDMGWSSYSGSYTSGSSERSLTFMTMDMLAGMGIRF